MSACSSQLSASLLGSASDEADSASTVHLPENRHRCSASAGKLHSPAPTASTSRLSRPVPIKSLQSKQRTGYKATSNPVTPRSPAVPAESVASQGQLATSTPQSSACSGQSQPTASSGISQKPHWQQSTAASSKRQQQNSSHATSKPSFLTRLQAQEGQTGPDKKQQHDAKAAEMKAKLQEWRQQQKQQKQQHQMQAHKQAPAEVSGRFKRPLLQQSRLAEAAGKPRAESADTG